MNKKIKTTTYESFSFILVIGLIFLLFGVYELFQSFQKLTNQGTSLCISVCFLSVYLVCFQRCTAISKREICFDENGILINYFFSILNQYFEYDKLIGYFEVKKSNKDYYDYKITLLTEKKKQLIFDLCADTYKQLTMELGVRNIQKISPIFSKPSLMFIPLFVVFSVVGLLLYYASEEKTEAAFSKNYLTTIKAHFSSIEKNYMKRGGKMLVDGYDVKLKEYTGLAFYLKSEYISSRRMDSIIEQQSDTTSFYFLLSNASYNLWVDKTVEPNFFQKYFNKGIEIYGMKTYNKIYFEAFP